MWFGHRFGKTWDSFMLSEFGINYCTSMEERFEMTLLVWGNPDGDAVRTNLWQNTGIWDISLFFWLKQALPPSPETTLPQKNMKKNWQRWADKDSALRYISPKDNFVCATWLRSNQLLHLTPGLKVVLVKIIIEKSGNATRKHETEWSCKVALGGIAAEYVTYGQANGGMSDLIQLEVGEDLMKIRYWCKYWWWVFMPGMPATTFHFLLHHFFWWLSILRGLLDA